MKQQQNTTTAQRAISIVATSFDNFPTLCRKYGHETMASRLDCLRQSGAIVAHGVDATNLVKSLDGAMVPVPEGGFDRIVFQFPLCAPSVDRRAFETSEVPAELRNRHLIWATLRGVVPVLAADGELWISSKKDGKYDMCHFDGTYPTELAKATSKTMSTLVFHRKWLFDAAQYPGYVTRNVDNNSSFPIEGALAYAFVHPANPVVAAAATPKLWGEWDCELCAVQCSGQKASVAHMAGNKHRRRSDLEQRWQRYIASVEA